MHQRSLKFAMFMCEIKYGSELSISHVKNFSVIIMNFIPIDEK